MELWTFNTEHIQEGETNSRIDIILIIWEDKFLLCECAVLEKNIFKGLHQTTDDAIIWTRFLKVLQTGTKLLHFSIFKVLPKYL